MYQYFTLLVTTTEILREVKYLIYFKMLCHQGTDESTQTQDRDSLINDGSCDESVL